MGLTTAFCVVKWRERMVCFQGATMAFKLKQRQVVEVLDRPVEVIPGLSNFNFDNVNESALVNNNGNVNNFVDTNIEIGNKGLPVKRDARGRLVKGSDAVAGTGRKRKNDPQVSRAAIIERTNYFHRKVMQAFLRPANETETILEHLIRTRQQDAMALAAKLTPDATDVIDLRSAALPQQNNGASDNGTQIVVTLNANAPANNNQTIDI